MTPSQLRQTVWALLIFFSLIGLIILAAGIRVCFLAGVSSSWPQVTGRIVSIGKTSHPGPRGGSTIGTAVVYDYTVGGQSYRGNRPTFGFAAGRFCQQLENMSSGDLVPISVDPRDASNSVMFPGIHVATCIPAFVGTGVLGFTFFFGFFVHRDPPWRVAE